jgi:hypothetical protein
MNRIYEIVDCNGLRYVGKTTLKLTTRLSLHITDKKRGKKCSSRKLDLDNCDINLLEVCDDSVKKERERHYINTLECVNINKLNGYQSKKYREKNRESLRLKAQIRNNFIKSWGGYPQKNNNLLQIDVNLFQ